MKKMLRALLNWMERKFPDQVVVTLAEFNAIQSEIKRLNDALKLTDEWAKGVKERLEKAEIAINNLNVSAGLTGLAADKFKMAPFMR